MSRNKSTRIESRPRGPSPGRPRFTYAQYVEFSSAAEFQRFRHVPPITAEEIAAVDWEALSQQLLQED